MAHLQAKVSPWSLPVVVVQEGWEGGLAVRAGGFEKNSLVGEQEATHSLNRAAQWGIKMASRSV